MPFHAHTVVGLWAMDCPHWGGGARIETYKFPARASETAREGAGAPHRHP
jgi:hypothetical protein